jgi:hypothetical protein
MVYKIKQYSYNKAKKIGVSIYPSNRRLKKIDVFSPDDEFICSIGDTRYKDYPTFLEEEGEEIAEMHRKAYRSRHAKELKKIGTPGWWAHYLLW